MSSPRLDAYSLRLFVSAADEGSIARAAAREHLSASALSRRVADLEHAFGTALLVRSPRGIELTEAGRLVYERGLQLEAGLAALLRDVQSSRGQVEGTVRLYANESSVVGFLPERLQRFGQAYPKVSIALQERLSGEVLRACLDDVADVGVCIAPSVPAGLDAWHFADDPLMVLLPAGHALAAAASLPFAEIARHPLVCVQTGGALDRQLRERAAAAGLALQIAVAVHSFDGVARMVEAGLGLAVLPQSAAKSHAGAPQFARRPLAEAWAPRALHLYALHKTPRPAAVAALIEALRG